MGHTGLFPWYTPQESAMRPGTIPAGTDLSRWRVQQNGRAVTPDRGQVQETMLLLGTSGPTPAAAGMKLLLYSWPHSPEEPYLPIRSSLPSMPASSALKSHACCARVEDLQPGTLDRDMDLPAAYPSHFRRLPDGTGHRLLRHWSPILATWFGLCEIEIPSLLPLGPFPVPAAAMRWSWPRQPGIYRAWLWAEQAQDAQAAGCSVQLLHGWGWDRFVAHTAPFVDRLLSQREMLGRQSVQGLIVKRLLNETIGVFGIGHRRTIEVPYELGAADTPILDREGHDTGRAYRRVPGRRTPIHWHRYCAMSVGRTIYHAALPYAEQGRLLRIRTDSIEIAA